MTLKNHTLFTTSPRASAGFTLIELLVVMVIISILSGLAFAGARAAMHQAHKSREIGAAKNLITAFLAYPTDHNGEMMPGYQAGASVTTPDGNVHSGPTAERYPLRLAEYADLDLARTFLLNPAKQGNPGTSGENFNYMVSLAPSLGMNAYCIGGYLTNSGYLANKHCAVSMQQLGANQAGNIVVFASAQLKQGQTIMEGNFIIKPPTMTATTNIHARYGGKAVVAYLDGHTEMNTPEELNDSTRWSPFATSSTERIRP
jgi:prepilin-type N-terminal cleavage/methylation domain-containing protein/prepilin-type processing-associated H-X9-DG protein